MGLISHKPIFNKSINYTIPNNYYFRVFAQLSICGRKVEILFKEYGSKPANFAEEFAAGNLHNSLTQAFGNPGEFAYDRNNDGADILDFGQRKAKQWLIDTVKNEDDTPYFNDSDIEIETLS